MLDCHSDGHCSCCCCCRRLTDCHHRHHRLSFQSECEALRTAAVSIRAALEGGVERGASRKTNREAHGVDVKPIPVFHSSDATIWSSYDMFWAVPQYVRGIKTPIFSRKQRHRHETDVVEGPWLSAGFTGSAGHCWLDPDWV